MQKLSSYIGSNLQKKAKLLHRLTLCIRMHLPANLANHCWIANIENRSLTVITDDPDHASLIRFQQREILKLLNQELNFTVKECLSRIKIKIGDIASNAEPPTKPPALSKPGARYIAKCANCIADKDLKEVLQRLASRT